MLIRRVLLATALLLASSSAWAQSAKTDDTAFGFNVEKMGPIGCVVDDTSTDTIQENNAGVIRCTAQRAAHVNVRNNSGTEVGTVAAPFNVQIGDGTETATVRDTGTSDSLNVSIVDANGNQISTFGGAGGTSTTDDTAGTAGTTQVTPIAGFADEVTPDSVDEGDVGMVRMTLPRALHVNPRDTQGDSLTDDGNNALQTTALSVIPGTGATNLGKAEDAAASNGDTGVMMLGRRNDSGATVQTSTNGDYSPVAVDAEGRIITSPSGGAGAATDNNAFTGGSSAGIPAFALFDTTPPTINDGTAGIPRMNANRDIRVAVVDSQGDDATDTANNSVKTSIISCGPCNATFDAAAPTGGHAIGGTDGTNFRAARTYDSDTGGGTQFNLGVEVRLQASGGSIPVPGDAANGIDVDVTRMAALPTGTNTIGNVGEVAVTTGGTTPVSYIFANSTNSTSVKASAGQLYGVVAFNDTGNKLYLKVYNTASAPTCGSGTPLFRGIIPANTNAAGFAVPIPPGATFSSGIGFCVTGAIGDADTTAVAANAGYLNVFYK